MADILIRDVPEHVLVSLDAHAKRLGLSRSEYIRRQLAADASRHAVTANDLRVFADMFADLDDPDVMARAWR